MGGRAAPLGAGLVASSRTERRHRASTGPLRWRRPLYLFRRASAAANDRPRGSPDRSMSNSGGGGAVGTAATPAGRPVSRQQTSTPHYTAQLLTATIQSPCPRFATATGARGSHRWRLRRPEHTTVTPEARSPAGQPCKTPPTSCLATGQSEDCVTYGRRALKGRASTDVCIRTVHTYTEWVSSKTGRELVLSPERYDAWPSRRTELVEQPGVMSCDNACISRIR